MVLFWDMFGRLFRCIIRRFLTGRSDKAESQTLFVSIPIKFGFQFCQTWIWSHLTLNSNCRFKQNALSQVELFWHGDIIDNKNIASNFVSSIKALCKLFVEKRHSSRWNEIYASKLLSRYGNDATLSKTCRQQKNQQHVKKVKEKNLITWETKIIFLFSLKQRPLEMEQGNPLYEYSHFCLVSTISRQGASHVGLSQASLRHRCHQSSCRLRRRIHARHWSHLSWLTPKECHKPEKERFFFTFSAMSTVISPHFRRGCFWRFWKV